jgi:hypothetical protein
MAKTAEMVPTVKTVPMVLMATTVPMAAAVLPAKTALKALAVQTDLVEPTAKTDHRVLKARLEAQEQPDQQEAIQASPGHKVPQVPMA